MLKFVIGPKRLNDLQARSVAELRNTLNLTTELIVNQGGRQRTFRGGVLDTQCQQLALGTVGVLRQNRSLPYFHGPRRSVMDVSSFYIVDIDKADGQPIQ
ncbi:hypothetical protein D9M69_460290 [compost metagenome]